MITDKRFRGRGFGTLLTATLARRQAALLAFIPHACWPAAAGYHTEVTHKNTSI